MHGNLHQLCRLCLYFLVQVYVYFPIILFGLLSETWKKELNNTNPTEKKPTGQLQLNVAVMSFNAKFLVPDTHRDSGAL